METKTLSAVNQKLSFLEATNNVQLVEKTNQNFHHRKLKDLGFFKTDTQYYKNSISNKLQILYSEDFYDFHTTLRNYTRNIDAQLSKVFDRNPYFRMNSILFFSPYQQTSNAYATITPHHQVGLFSSGPFFIDQRAISHWTWDVLVHELTHSYQMSQNLKVDRLFWWLIGPLSYRNVLSNSFVLEGHAVLHESIYGYGGRLFSGWARAFVFSGLKHNISLKRVLKSYDDSFSSTEKYLQGGYFFAYLHSQYGLKKTNQFFYENGKYVPIGYFGLNSSFKRTFGKNLPLLFKEYKKYYAPLVDQQKSSIEKPILTSHVFVPMNSDQKNIYFLVSDTKSSPRLILFDKISKKITKYKKPSVPIGKAFYKNDQYYFASNGFTSSSLFEYSLFDEQFKPLKNYNSEYVMDMTKDKVVSLDTKQSHTQNSLFVNHKFYDTTHSSAVIDPQGRVYYFKQDGDVRTLYRDRQAVFHFKSYYAYPVEADKESLYFISSTKYGSSLFVYKGDSVFRLSESDTIISARKIKGKEFLVSEINFKKYEYKIISTQEVKELPVSYKYSFKKSNFLKTQTPVDETEGILSDEKLVQKNIVSSHPSSELTQTGKKDLAFKKDDTVREKISDKKISSRYVKSSKYYSFQNLTLQNLSFFYTPSVKFFTFIFLDPLLWNQLSASIVFEDLKKEYFLSYLYKKYRPVFGLNLKYNETLLDSKEDEYRIQSYKDIGFLTQTDICSNLDNTLVKKSSIPYRSRSIDLSISYPLLKRNHWSVVLFNNLEMGQKQFNNTNKPWIDFVSHQGGLSYRFNRKYSQAFSSNKAQGLSVFYEMTHIKNKENSYNRYLNGQVQMYLAHELSREWYITLNGVVRRKMWKKELESVLLQRGSSIYSSFTRRVRSLNRFDFQILKVLNHAYYPLMIPVDIRRWAPFLGFSVLSFQESHKQYEYFLVPFVGLEIESSLNENLIIKIGISGEYVWNFINPNKNPQFQYSAWLKGTF